MRTGKEEKKWMTTMMMTKNQSVITIGEKWGVARVLASLFFSFAIDVGYISAIDLDAVYKSL